MHVIWETDRWLQKYCASNSTSNQVMELSVEKTTQSPVDGVPAYEALTLNFARISSLVRLSVHPATHFNMHNIHRFLATATSM